MVRLCALWELSHDDGDASRVQGTESALGSTTAGNNNKKRSRRGRGMTKKMNWDRANQNARMAARGTERFDDPSWVIEQPPPRQRVKPPACEPAASG